jgi:hypothetical protein
MCRQRVVKPARERSEREVSTEKIDFDAGMLSTRHCGSLEIERGSSARETERISLLPAASQTRT